jgi:hypothetical protein
LSTHCHSIRSRYYFPLYTKPRIALTRTRKQKKAGKRSSLPSLNPNPNPPTHLHTRASDTCSPRSPRRRPRSSGCPPRASTAAPHPSAPASRSRPPRSRRCAPWASCSRRAGGGAGSSSTTARRARLTSRSA